MNAWNLALSNLTTQTPQLGYKQKKCTICGAMFTPNRSRDKRCSDECKRRHDADINKLYRARKKNASR